jgi:hypothetical protein
MPNKALRLAQPDWERRRWIVPTSVLVMLGVWLSSLVSIAAAVFATKPQERADLWGPLGWISQHPGPAIVIVTAVASLLALWLWQREQASSSSPPSDMSPNPEALGGRDVTQSPAFRS